MYSGMPAGAYPYAGLGDIFSDISRIAGKVGIASGKVSAVASQASDVARGKKKVALIPPSGSYATVPVPGQPFGVTFPMMPVLLGGAALVAYLLLSRRR